MQSKIRLWNYSKTCVKWPLKNRQNKILVTNGSLRKVKSTYTLSGLTRSLKLDYGITVKPV